MSVPTREASKASNRAGARSERGGVLLIVLLSTLILSVLSLSLARSSGTDLDIAANVHAGQQAFYAADGAMAALFDSIVNETSNLGRFPTTSEIAGLASATPTTAQISSSSASTVGSVTNATLTTGTFQGLVASTQIYDGVLTAETNTYPKGVATVRMRAAIDLIPVFQFAAMYERDLELHPGALMTVTGRVHTNGDMYLTSNDGLYFESNVTAVGTINEGKKLTGEMYRDDTYFKNALGIYLGMNGLSSVLSTWHDDALLRWSGNVRSDVHGVDRLELTIPNPSHPRGLVEPGLSTDTAADEVTKLYHKAGLRILNGVLTDANGITVSPLTPSGDSAIRYTVIDDAREQHPMLVYEIDVDTLGHTPAWPANGLIYVASTAPGNGVPAFSSWPSEWSGYTAPYDGGNTEFAVKLTNGSNLPAALTVVSDNPVYVRGNYNTSNKKGAAVIADTVTLLSNNWGRKNSSGSLSGSAPDDDLGYSQLNMSSRTAANTTYNVAIMGGNTETVSGSASGGLHNVLRYLESWSGRTSTYRGSIVILWYSDHAYSEWYCCPSSGFYRPPNRAYSFDTDYLDPANLPPYTPSAVQVRVQRWSRE